MIIIIMRLYDRAEVRTNKFRSPFKSTLNVVSHLTKIKCKPMSVTSAGLQAVFLPKEDSADTDAAERPLMARNDGRAEATCYAV